MALEVGDIIANLIARVDTRGFKEFDRSAKESREHAERLKETLKDIGKITIGALGVTALADQLKEASTAALTQQEAMSLFEGQLKRSRLEVERHVVALERLEGVTRQRGFTDTEVTRAMTANVRVAGSWRGALQLLNAETNTARARNMDLTTVMPMFLRGALGMVGGFRRVGLEVKASSTATDAAKKSLAAHVATIDTAIKKTKAQEGAALAVAHAQHVTSLSAYDLRQAYERAIASLEAKKKATEDAAKGELAHAKALDATRTKGSLAAQVNRQVGGSAEDASRTAIGSYRRFNAEIDHLRETFGRRLLPEITATMDYLSGPGIHAAEQWKNTLQPAIDTAATTFGYLKTGIGDVESLLGPQGTREAVVGLLAVVGVAKVLRSVLASTALLEIVTNPAGMFAGARVALAGLVAEGGLLEAVFAPESLLAVGIVATGALILKLGGFFDHPISQAQRLRDAMREVHDAVRSIDDAMRQSESAGLDRAVRQRENAQLVTQLQRMQRRGQGDTLAALRVEQQIAENRAAITGDTAQLGRSRAAVTAGQQRAAAAVTQAAQVSVPTLQRLEAARGRGRAQLRLAREEGAPPAAIERLQSGIGDLTRAIRWQTTQQAQHVRTTALPALVRQDMAATNLRRNAAGMPSLAPGSAGALGELAQMLWQPGHAAPIALQRLTQDWGMSPNVGGNIRTITGLTRRLEGAGVGAQQVLHIIADASGPEQAIRRLQARLQRATRLNIDTGDAERKLGRVQQAIDQLGADAWMSIGMVPITSTPARRRAKGGKETTPTYHVISGEDTSGGLHPEYFIPTKPAYRREALALFADLGRTLGVQMAAAGGKASTRWVTVQTPSGPVRIQEKLPKPVKPSASNDAWLAYLQKRQDAYNLALSGITLATSQAGTTPTSFADDVRAYRSQQQLDRERINEIRHLIDDPRSRRRPQAVTDLRNEEARLIAEITSLTQQATSVVTQAGGLTQRQQYLMSEAQRGVQQNVAGAAGDERRLLRRQIATLNRQRRAAFASGDYATAAALSQAEGQAQSQLTGLNAPSADAQAYLGSLANEAAAMLGTRATWARTSGAAAGRRVVSLASLATGGRVQIVHQTIHTLHPGDPHTLRAIAEANARAGTLTVRPRTSNPVRPSHL